MAQGKAGEKPIRSIHSEMLRALEEIETAIRKARIEECLAALEDVADDGDNEFRLHLTAEALEDLRSRPRGQYGPTARAVLEDVDTYIATHPTFSDGGTVANYTSETDNFMDDRLEYINAIAGNRGGEWMGDDPLVDTVQKIRSRHWDSVEEELFQLREGVEDFLAEHPSLDEVKSSKLEGTALRKGGARKSTRVLMPTADELAMSDKVRNAVDGYTFVLGAWRDENAIDRRGRDIAGRDKEGYDVRGWNEDGWHRSGVHRNGTLRDDDGYDFFGEDERGVDRRGFIVNESLYRRANNLPEPSLEEALFAPIHAPIHVETGTEYGPDGYSHCGLDRNGKNRFGR